MKFEPRVDSPRIRTTWLGVLTAVIAFTGLAILLFILFSTIDGMFSIVEGRADLTVRVMKGGTVPWYLVQAILGLSAALAGMACIWFSPASSRLAPGICLTLIALYYVFAQFPAPTTWLLDVFWLAVLPCGFLAGLVGGRRLL